MNKQERKSGFWKRFFRMLSKTHLPWLWIIITFVITISSSAIYLLVPDYTNQVLDGDLSSNTILIFVLTLVASFVINAVSYWLQEVAGAKITRSMRKSIWGKITGLPLTSVEQKGAKELISRTTTDTVKLSTIFSSSLPGIAATVYYVVGAMREVGYYDRSMSAIFLIVALAQVVLAFISGRVVFGLRERTQRKLSEMTEGISEVMSNIPLVKIFTAEDTETKRGHALINEYNTSDFNTQVTSNAFTYGAQLVNLMGTLVIIIYGAVLVQRGTIDVGAWVAFFMYYNYAKNDLNMMPYYWKELKDIQGSVARLTEIIEMDDENLEQGLAVQAEQKDFTVSNLSFAYEDAKIFDQINFKIPAGKSVALVGENGAGKTTFIKLLERFYEPQSGTITYGDHKMEDTSIRSWRSLFSYVPQDVRMMGGTIRDNLTYGITDTISDAELDQVCEQVHLKEFIDSLPERYETMIEDFGDNISGGQRQKIAIARSILFDRECLILDEYTSSLDTESIEHIHETIQALHGKKTMLLIAHNFETIRMADSIVVLARGKVEAAGSHEELKEKSETYRKLLYAQYEKGEIADE